MIGEALRDDGTGVAQGRDRRQAGSTGGDHVLHEDDLAAADVATFDPPAEAMALGFLAYEDRRARRRERERAAVGNAGALDAGDDRLARSRQLGVERLDDDPPLGRTRR